MLFKPADGGPRCTHGGAELEDDEGWEKPAGKSRGRRVAHGWRGTSMHIRPSKRQSRQGVWLAPNTKGARYAVRRYPR